MKKTLIAGSVVVLACLTLTACSGSSSSSRKVEVKPPVKEGETIASPNDVYSQLESTDTGGAK